MENLAADIIEGLVQQLEVRDICNLRLVSKTLAAKTSYGVFKSFFRSCDVCWLDEDRLQSLALLTTLGHAHDLGLAVQNLTLYGRVIDERADEQPDQIATSKAMSYITLILKNLMERDRPQKQAKSLTLDVRDERSFKMQNHLRKFGRGYQGPIGIVWECAARTLELTAGLLVQTAIEVDALNLFASDENECGIAVDRLASLLDRHDLSIPLSRLRRLSLRISQSLPQNDSNNDQAASNSNTLAVRRLIELCPNIESLQLQWYSRRAHGKMDLARTEQESQFVLNHLTDMSMSSLHHLRLGGFCCNEATLLAFVVSRKELRSLHIEDTSVIEFCGYRSIFHHITTQIPELKDVYFNDLFELIEEPFGLSHVCFVGPGKPTNPTSMPEDEDECNGPNFIRRHGPDVHEPIQYYTMRRSYAQGVSLIKWRNERARRFGPPAK